MPDDADITQARTEAEAELFRRRKREPGLLPICVCYYCGSPINSGVLFCDVYCRDDYEREQRLLAFRGRR
jgi:hypothetical protein